MEPTRTLIERLFAVLDYDVLGEVYCDEGGDAFWQEHRGPALENGLVWARAVAERLRPGGCSLYAGAGVAELPAVVTEVRDLGRRVVATNRRSAECDAINAALREVGVDPAELRIEECDAATRACDGPFDHVALVSVLTDPETWPVLSDVTYGLVPPVLLDVAQFTAERDEAGALAAAVLGALELPGTVTTTVDEIPWIMHWAAERGVEVEADELTIATALVGDPLGFLRIEPGD